MATRVRGWVEERVGGGKYLRREDEISRLSN